ncbi:response regulator [Candidatus Microgenomates bacterium]|nr:response regulator [Candidatus Microgenomates bacterium]
MANKIAIVEDDVAIVQMYRMKFEAEGYTVQTAGSGKEGLAMIESFSPDIILLDLMMPEMGGADMLEELRKQPWGKKTKVIILTNMGESEAPAKVRQLGVEDFIVKADMTPKQVADKVKSLL